MNATAIVLSSRTRAKLQREARRTDDADYRTRCLIVLRSADRWARPRIAAALNCSVSLIGKVRRRWLLLGLAGLIDRREDNGERKADDRYVACVQSLLKTTPRQWGHRRPTWTKALLIKVAAKLTGGVIVSKTTMGRVLASLRARRGRAKPIARQVWSKRRIARRMRKIHALIDKLPSDEMAVWEDEVDIDLNPRIGADWTLPGTQRLIPTPGQNVKRYFALALDATNDRVTWMKGQRKSSRLFIDLLKRLLARHPDKKKVHVICDNYNIHSSRQTQAWLSEFGGDRIVLHFLPPYCPDENRCERKLCREIHANVTTNHLCGDIDELCHETTVFLMTLDNRARAASAAVHESRRAI